jgi:hypothetical protein
MASPTKENVMPSVTRVSVFETNSSSTHSFSLGEGDYVPDKMFVDENGVVTIETGEFGWEEEVYRDAYTKASYLATYLQNLDGPHAHDLKKKFTWYIKNAITKNTNAKTVVIEHSPFAYIDHQSLDRPAKIFEGKLATVERFIFHPGSRLKTDNDNH